MVRFYWRVEEGFGALVHPGMMARHSHWDPAAAGDSDVWHAFCEMEVRQRPSSEVRLLAW